MVEVIDMDTGEIVTDEVRELIKCKDKVNNIIINSSKLIAAGDLYNLIEDKKQASLYIYDIISQIINDVDYINKKCRFPNQKILVQEIIEKLSPLDYEKSSEYGNFVLDIILKEVVYDLIHII